MITLISLQYLLMYRDLYNIWFPGSHWLARVVREELVILVVGSQEPSGKWAKSQLST